MIYRNGDRLCNCTLLQKCGSGSYGEVWLAEDAIGTRVALKIIANRGSYSERELAGLRNYKECNHPNLLKIRYVEITDDRICYTMDTADNLNRGEGEYLPDTLANRLQRSGRLDGKEIALMLDGLLAGLEELHRRKLVHRDIKPDNILWVNGRATLADAGLIAPDGKGSLVGTPGFLSPKLMAGRGSADASDDFYALGKVIYCALTGLPVREYPGLPEDMTISVDAGLNRALRESCTHPIGSAAEFRRLLREPERVTCQLDENPATDRKPMHIFGIACGIFALIGLLFLAALVIGVVLFFLQMKEPESQHIPESAEEPVPTRETGFQAAVRTAAEKLPPAAMELQTRKDPDRELQKEVQKLAVEQFQKLGFFSDGGRLLPVLLEYEVLTADQISDLLLKGSGNPRLQTRRPIVKENRTPSALEQELAKICSHFFYPDFDPDVVKRRQNHWRVASGTNAVKQNAMLTEDPIMQAVALDALIRSGVNRILAGGELPQEEKDLLRSLLLMRYSLLDPGKARLYFD